MKEISNDRAYTLSALIARDVEYVKLTTRTTRRERDEQRAWFRFSLHGFSKLLHVRVPAGAKIT